MATDLLFAYSLDGLSDVYNPSFKSVYVPDQGVFDPSDTDPYGNGVDNISVFNGPGDSGGKGPSFYQRSFKGNFVATNKDGIEDGEDITSPLQDLINNVPEGTAIYFPSGEYTISSKITVSRSVGFFGGIGYRNGAASVDIGGAVLKMADGANDDMLLFDGKNTNCLVYGLALYGNRGNNTSGNGITVENLDTYLTVRDCNISHFAENGIAAVNGTTNAAFITNNAVYYNVNDGIRWAAGADSIISGNSIGRNGRDGISVGSANNRIWGNHCWISGRNGIRVSGADNIVGFNRCNNSQKRGIYVPASERVSVVSNHVDDNGQDTGATNIERAGIVVDGSSDQCIVALNTASGGGGAGGTGSQIIGIAIRDTNVTNTLAFGNRATPDHGNAIDVSEAEFGAFGNTASQQSALTPANGSTVDGTYGNEERDVIQNNVTRISEIESALQAYGLLQ